MFESILIANRGEIACRVIRTLKRLGIRSVAVCSEADRGAQFTQLADAVIEIGPAPARESYLVAHNVLQAADQSGAQAIHPGYGFLSENAAFAAECAARGLTFIGPSPGAIAAMGMKDSAKALLERAGVPVVPGYHAAEQDLATLAAAAEHIGYPVLIKAVAGGGGKGMRRVDGPLELAAALEAARREAASAFADDRVLLEKYLTRSRHIEVQVFADRYGNAVHLFERDCSLQRRHQKVLEEAPAPNMPPAMRAAMGQAAVRCAQAIGYEGAGTVEFIADVSNGLDPERFYFMEMNTRLQVEHPVTECITGLDLVEWQIRVAAGERLPLSQSELSLRGHAIEVRLYAEDPRQEYMPQTGELLELALPEQGPHVRIDSGVVRGDTVSIFYDPMLAKLIVWDEDRERALRRLRRTLSEVEVLGLTTNTALLARVAAHPAFQAAVLHTGFLAEHERELLATDPRLSDELFLLACMGLINSRARTAPVPGDPFSPWSEVNAFRVNDSHSEQLLLQGGLGVRRFTLTHVKQPAAPGAEELSVAWQKEPADPAPNGAWPCSVRAVTLLGTRLSCMVDGVRLSGRYAERGGIVHVSTRGESASFEHPFVERSAEREAEAGERVVKAPMPGKIIGVLVAAGESIEHGQPLVRLEAMKMEHTLRASVSGVVSELFARPGEQVEAGSTLLVLRGSEEGAV